MMKTVCVAVVVLTLFTGGQPAPLACEKLMKPLEKGPDVTGKWYAIAISSDYCLYPVLMNMLFSPSVSLDITLKSPPITYNGDVSVKIYGYCANHSEEFRHDGSTVSNVNDISDPPSSLLHTDCPDCLVTKDEESSMLRSLILWSRRQTVTAAELLEFETQAKCLGWSKPQILNTDHDQENCHSLDMDRDFSDEESTMIMASFFQKAGELYMDVIKCLTNIFYK